ncbi:MAG: lysylphosphatidylglycerol synthase domain-containing protein [Bacteriovoracaceae bacterium]|nr:lysylphosphatidylglycerol synthase domain-containing protein [Bacteriovoracaceae bacterium]
MEISIRKKKKVVPFLTFGFFCLILYLLYQSLHEINFHEVGMAIRKVSLTGLLPGFFMVIINYLILASFDYLGLRYLNVKDVSAFKIYWSAFTCYTFTLNLGALVGGLGLRYRIYSGWHISVSNITKLIIFSTLGNWLGHIFLLSMVVGIYPEKVNTLTSLPFPAIYAITTLGTMAIILYFVLCFKRAQVSFKSEKFTFPPVQLAFLQLILSIMQWSLLAAIIVSLMDHLGASVEFMQIIFTYLLTGLAGVVSHIPAGLGVHEAVFLKMNLDIPESTVIAVLVAFRVIYYLVPLLLAAPGYLFIEIYHRKNHSQK